MGIQGTRHLAGSTYCVHMQGIASGGAFVDEYCRQHFLIRLFSALQPYQVKLHAYTVLENEAYLLVTPSLRTGLSAMVSAVQANFGEYYQTRFERNSIPISKNIRASEVSGYELTLHCQKFIERLALDIGSSDLVGTWQWSSYTANGFGCRPRYLTLHKHYLRFLAEKLRPYPGYRSYIAAPLEPKFHAYLLSRIRSGKPITKRIGVRKSTVTRKTVHRESDPTKNLILG
jgi:hypothetical protein